MLRNPPHFSYSTLISVSNMSVVISPFRARGKKSIKDALWNATESISATLFESDLHLLSVWVKANGIYST